MRLITIGALSALILSACGYQGPLYLPDAESTPKQSTVPAVPLVPATPAAAADDQDDPDAGAAAATQS
ncbi:MAG: lipoprotein [Neisseriaceae bacterium]|nr:lipoprotein [Neisseriaceae bacterium]MBP6862997.1 lipoprotein [Neisseriaceae bacterium]